MGRNRKCVEHEPVLNEEGRKRTQTQYVCRKCFKNGTPTKIQQCQNCGGWHTTHNFGRESANCVPSNSKNVLKRSVCLKSLKRPICVVLRKTDSYDGDVTSEESCSPSGSSSGEDSGDDDRSPRSFKFVSYEELPGAPALKRVWGPSQHDIQTASQSQTNSRTSTKSPFETRDAASILLGLAGLISSSHSSEHSQPKMS